MTGDKIFIKAIERAIYTTQALPQMGQIEKGAELLKNTMRQINPKAPALFPPQQLKTSYLLSEEVALEPISSLQKIIIDLECAVAMTDEFYFLAQEIYSAIGHLVDAKELLEF